MRKETATVRVVALVILLFILLLMTVGCSLLSTRQQCVELLGEIHRDYNALSPVLFEWNGEWYAAMCGQKQGDTSMLLLLQNIYVQEDKQEFIIATPGKFFPVNFTVVPINSETLHLLFSGGLAEEGNELKKEPREKEEPTPGDFWEKHYELKRALLCCELKPHKKGENGNTCKVVWHDNIPESGLRIPGGWIKVYKGPSEYIIYWADVPFAGERSAYIRWYSSSTRQVQQIEAKDCRDVWLHSGDSGPTITVLLLPTGSQIRRMPLGAGDVSKSELLYWTDVVTFILYADDEEYVAFTEDIYPCLLDVKERMITKIAAAATSGNLRVLKHGGDKYFVFANYSPRERAGIHIRKICLCGLSLQEQFIPLDVPDARIYLQNYAIIGHDFVFLFDKDCPERDTRQFYCGCVPLKK